MITNKPQQTMPSNRNFGLNFMGMCFLFTGIKIINNDYTLATWWFLAGVVLWCVAQLFPYLLTPFNMVWAKFGELLHKITTPIILGLLYYVLFTPIGFIMRLCGWDPLRLRDDAKAKSYWILKEDNQPKSSMYNQF